MVIVTYVYTGEAYWRETRRAEEGEMAEVTSKIRSFYDAGIPFYTKEALRDVSRQLERLSEKGQKVSVRGLDGSMVDFEIESGLILPAGEPDLEMVLRAPFVSYLPVQILTSDTQNNIPRIAYCSLRIHHYMDMRNKLTKELISPAPRPPRGEVEKFFQTARNAWEASEPYAQLCSILTSTAIPCEIRKIVGFACGPMVYGGQEPDTHRAAFQHALILTLRDVLGKKQANSNQIECYAQDPAYTEIDDSVLDGSGIAVLEDPHGFLQVDDSTVVVSCAASVPVKQIISDLARPALLIWDRIFEREPDLLFLDPDSPRVRDEIYHFYDSLEFTGDLEHFGDIVIYVRRTVPRSPGIHGVKAQDTPFTECTC